MPSRSADSLPRCGNAPPNLAQFDYQAQGIVYGLLASEDTADFGIQQNEIGPRVEAFRVFPPLGALQQLTKIVLGAQLVTSSIFRFLHILFFQFGSIFER